MCGQRIVFLECLRNVKCADVISDVLYLRDEVWRRKVSLQALLWCEDHQIVLLHQCVQYSYFVYADKWEVVSVVIFQQCFLLQCGHCYSYPANGCAIRQVHACVLCAAKFCQSAGAYICEVFRKKFITNALILIRCSER